jgi:hypothetical protein
VPEKIVSGGQTGADRAALEVAAEWGLATGGWVPRGRRAEDGRVPERYRGLLETDSPAYALRTELNVRDSDATLILSFGRPRGGTALTRRLARRLGRPVLALDLERLGPDEALARATAWLGEVRPRVLNVAGPRASQQPGIGAAVRDLLRRVLAASRGEPPA